MFVIFLKFSKNKMKAPEFMQKHIQWIEDGYKSKSFLLTGSIKPGLGGFILSNTESKEDLFTFLQNDPFVKEEVVSVEIVEVEPSRASNMLQFLIDGKED